MHYQTNSTTCITKHNHYYEANYIFVVNGDGLGDFFVADQYFYGGSRVYVFFGSSVREDRSAIGLASSGTGFQISAAQNSYRIGQFANCIGDVNGDGFDDIAVGGARYEPLLSGYVTLGAVIFGHSNRTAAFADIQIIDESTAFGGFIFTAPVSYATLSRAGDFNNDGFDDMLVGLQNKAIFVLFGHSNATSFDKIDLDSFASSSSAGFQITSSGYGITGEASHAGDVNGDGIDDILIGSSAYWVSAYVIFGHTNAEPFADIDLQNFLQHTRGFTIGFSSYYYGSLSVAVGDVNNDGIGDLLLGAPTAYVGNSYGAGKVYVLNGMYETPTAGPTAVPTAPTPLPSTIQPSADPSMEPTMQPTFTPAPTTEPSHAPTLPPVITVFGDVVLHSDSDASASGFRIDGASDGDLLGTAVAYGDVNGDGVSDVLLSAPMASYADRFQCGIVIILFGRGSTVLSPNIDIATLTPEEGVILYGNTSQRMGYGLTVLGDVNGDGIADILVGSYKLNDNDGAVYVVYGRFTWTDIDLTVPLATSSSPSGYEIFPLQESLGWPLVVASKAGDVNGDGLSDFVISNAQLGGQATVVFGSTMGGDIYLSSFVSGEQGYHILSDVGFRVGLFMSDAGDFNGDGFDDIIIASQKTGSMIYSNAPVVQVLYGHSNQTTFSDVQWSTMPVPPSVGFAVSTGTASGQFKVSRAGDFNGDGFDDVMVSNPQYAAGPLFTVGRTRVLFGRDSTHPFPSIDFLTPDTYDKTGFVVTGGAGSDFSGFSLASAGDVNGDGFDDILIGARIASVLDTGMVYVLFGHSTALPFPDINLGAFYAQTRGFRVLNNGLGGTLGMVVSSAGDMNQDGYSDVIVVATSGDSRGRVNNGAAYVVYGMGETPTAGPTAVPSTSTPSVSPTFAPTAEPTAAPTLIPTANPSDAPTVDPSVIPSAVPTVSPSVDPTAKPSVSPTAGPSADPSADPSVSPSEIPTIQPSVAPTLYPSAIPTLSPSADPSTGPTLSPTVQPTLEPTVSPSVGPSEQPTEDPTVVPSVSPTLSPSNDPSAGPSVGPTVGPTTTPSVLPTLDPTAAPSVGPTADPTIDPTAGPTELPTVSPSSLPTEQPSYEPTIDPSASPSASPSILPTEVPSVKPTVTPSEAPTIVPTAHPTAAPSVNPSAGPSRRPSVDPTARPSANPSILPTVVPGNTQSPSRAPTQLPTLSTADLWRGKLQDLLQVVAASRGSDVAHTVTYSDVVVATSIPPNLFGSCVSWRTLLQGELSVANALYRPLALTLAVQQSLNSADAPVVVTCSDANAANAVLQAFLGDSTQLQSVKCANHDWSVRTCSAGAAPALCVDCEDPCNPSLQCASTSTSTTAAALVVTPCVTSVCTGTSSSLASAARVLSVSYKELQPAPTVISQTHTVSKTAVTVQATLSSTGSVSCGAFAVNAQSGEASAPSSVSNILLQNFAASTDATNTSVVVLSGLQAASKYQIYCLAVSPLGTQQTLTQSAAQSFVAITACCIDVTVRAAATALKTGSSATNFLTLNVAARPAASVTLSVTLHSASTGAVATMGSFFPATFTLNALQQATGSSLSSSASVFTASLPSLPAGEYFYTVTLSGESAYQYAVSYASSTTTLTVLAVNEPLPAPGLVSAVFASDGSHVVISFDAKSDKGGVATEFTCAQLFAFACADKSTCVWASSSQVNAYVSNSAGCAAVDTSVSLVSSASIRAECIGSNCDNLSGWPTSSTAVSVIIRSPASAIATNVIVSAPNSVGECDSLTLDLSSSSGSGGRPWVSRSVRVDSLAPAEFTSSLQQMLDGSNQASALIAIPASYISKGYAYSFMVKQCNFLGQCSQATKRVLAQSSTIPTVSLPGASLRTVKRSASLSISSEAYYVPCQGSATRTGLTYSWSLAVNGVQDLSFTSASKDPSKLLIAANTLAVNTLYDVTLTVTIASTLQSASATVQVFVASGEIVPVIARGLSRSVRVDQVVTLDAAQSYDEDQLGLTAREAGISFDWSCVQVSPVYAESCSNVLALRSSSGESAFAARASVNAAGAVVEVTLTLLDASQSRTARSTVTVTVLPSLSPVVSISSNAADGGILNSNRELQLTGEVTFPVGYNGSVTWSVDDTSAFSLFDSARSPLMSLIGSSGAPQSIYLVVAANSLPGRSTLTFSLTARLQAAEGTTAVASVPVRVNAPPILGLFSVSPLNGTEIVDHFTFLASQWVDSDLPLQYLFAYVSSSGVEVTLRSKKEATYSTLALTAGLKTDNYAVKCVVHVFDALSAVASRTQQVAVFPEERDPTALAGLIEASLMEGTDSVDGKKQSAALGSYLLNQVNCTAAPNCTALNRQNCFRTVNTCGECLSSSYVGTAGDSNQACAALSGLPARRKLTSLATSTAVCGSDVDCSLFETCGSAGVCVRELMQCKSNCSYPQGTCSFVDINSGDAVEVCYVGDSSCRASCDCTAGYEGSETCSLNSAQLLERQHLRLRLVQSIKELIASEDADLESVEGWINTLLQVAQVPDELSEDAAHLLLSAADSIIATATQLGVSADVVMSLLTAVDAAVQASNDRSARRRRMLTVSTLIDTRRLLESAYDYNVTLARTEGTLAQFRAFLQSSLLPNQNAFKLVLPQFRVVSQVLSGSALPTDGADVSMSLPLSALEIANGQTSSSISVPVVDSGDASALFISLSSLRSEPFNRQLGLSGYDQVFSNPLTVDLTGSSCTSGNQCRFEMTLQTAAALSAAVNDAPVVESYNTTCAAGVVRSAEVVCADGTVVPVLCDGTDSVVVSSCPVVTYSPICNALVGTSGPADSGCFVLSSTATSITCSCPINAAINSRRLQTTDNPEEDGEATVSVSYVGMLSQIKGNFVNTVVSAQGLNASTLERGWSAMATVGALAVAILFAFYWSHQADAEMEKVVPVSEKAKKLALVSPAQVKRDTRRAKTKRPVKSVADRDVQIAEQALPSILSSQSLSKRVAVEVKQHHKWFGIVFHFSRNFPRVLRVASLATNVIIMLFIQSLTYSLTSGDDGSCATYNTRDTCLEERSAYATGTSKCYWTETSEKCAFVEPDGDIMVILFVAIFSAIVCTPFALLVDWIIIYVLSAPTKASSASNSTNAPRDVAAFNRHRLRTASGEFVETASPGAADSRARTVSTDVYEMTNAIMMGSRRRTRNESMDIQSNRGRTVSTNSDMFEIVPGQINTQHGTVNVGDGHGSARDSVFGSVVMLRGNSTIDNGIQLSAQSDLRLLVEDISRYRDTLSEEDRTEFDLLWGLDEHGCFKTDDELQSGLLHRIKSIVTCSGQSGATSSGSVSQRVLLDLRAVHENLVKEEALAVARSFDNRQKGRRLLFLFQRDLLPGVSGMILESKGQRDNISAPQVSREAKIAAWTFLAVANVCMLFYILLFALSQTVHRQGAWAMSFILWLVVEILLVSSLTVVFTHILVPSLIMQDVKKIKMKLVESIRAFNHNVKNRTMQGENGGTSGGPFNAANYLFTSTRLAKKWPELREAQIISQFRTPWPKQSYMRELNVSKKYSRKYTALTRSASIIIIFFMTQILQVPPGLQDMVVQMVATASIGYTILLHLDLYNIFPLLAFLPLMLVIVIVHFVLQSSKASAQQEMNKMLAPPLAADKVKGQGSRKLQAIAPADEPSVHGNTSIKRTNDAVEAELVDDDSDDMYYCSSEDENSFGELNMPLPSSVLSRDQPFSLTQPSGHVNRKQSVQMGVQVLRALQAQHSEGDQVSTLAEEKTCSEHLRSDPSSSCSHSDSESETDTDAPAVRVAVRSNRPTQYSSSNGFTSSRPLSDDGSDLGSDDERGTASEQSHSDSRSEEESGSDFESRSGEDFDNNVEEEEDESESDAEGIRGNTESNEESEVESEDDESEEDNR